MGQEKHQSIEEAPVEIVEQEIIPAVAMLSNDEHDSSSLLQASERRRSRSRYDGATGGNCKLGIDIEIIVEETKEDQDTNSQYYIPNGNPLISRNSSR